MDEKQGEKMKIVESQKQIILLEIESLYLENLTLRNQKQGLGCYGTRPSDSDYHIIQIIAENERRIKELEHIAKYSEVIENPNSKKIEIGSRCKIFLKYSKTEYDCLDTILIEQKISKEPLRSYTSKNSQLGKAIYHKKIGGGFRYRQVDGSTVCGKIISLEFSRPEIGKTYAKAPQK